MVRGPDDMVEYESNVNSSMVVSIGRAHGMLLQFDSLLMVPFLCNITDSVWERGGRLIEKK